MTSPVTAARSAVATAAPPTGVLPSIHCSQQRLPQEESPAYDTLSPAAPPTGGESCLRYIVLSSDSHRSTVLPTIHCPQQRLPREKSPTHSILPRSTKHGLEVLHVLDPPQCPVTVQSNNKRDLQMRHSSPSLAERGRDVVRHAWCLAME